MPTADWPRWAHSSETSEAAHSHQLFLFRRSDDRPIEDRQLLDRPFYNFPVLRVERWSSANVAKAAANASARRRAPWRWRSSSFTFGSMPWQMSSRHARAISRALARDIGGWSPIRGGAGLWVPGERRT